MSRHKLSLLVMAIGALTLVACYLLPDGRWYDLAVSFAAEPFGYLLIIWGSRLREHGSQEGR